MVAWRWVVLSLVLTWLGLAGTVGAQSWSEDFEVQSPGALPAGWLDVRLFNNPGNLPNPSAVVVATTDTVGGPTQAVALVDALAPSQGIYRELAGGGPHSFYQVSADVRVDQFSDNAQGTASDWAIEVGFSNTAVGGDFSYIQQLGIYASSFDQTWWLWMETPNKVANLALGVSVTIGTWYRVELTIFADTGAIRSRIVDILSGTVLVDRTQTLADDIALQSYGPWDPAIDGNYTDVSFFDSELSPDATRGNVTLIDNVTCSLSPAPAEVVGDLVDAVENLVALGELNAGQGNALIAKLAAAIAKLDQGKLKAAHNLLSAFIKQVEAMMPQRLSVEQGQPLVDLAESILAQLTP